MMARTSGRCLYLGGFVAIICSFSLNIYLLDKLYNTIQYNTINTIHYNTIQYKEFTNWDPERSLLLF